MDAKDDSVFQVSLTEIAFTLVLLMLLLLGHRLAVSLQEISRQKELIEHYEYISQNKTKFGGMCTPDPEDPIDTMMPCIKCLSVAGKLTKEESSRSIELGRNLLEQWKAHDSKVKFDEYQKKVSEIANKLAQGKKVVALEEIQEMAQKVEALTEEHKSLVSSNKKLMTQNAYLQRRAGMDDPPCWISEETFRPQYLFSVLIRSDLRYEVVPNWPKERETEAYAIPGVKEMVKQRLLPRSEFNRYSGLILEHSKQNQPQACRHFVVMRSEIPDRVVGDKARLNLEQFFYKYEIVQ